MTNERPTMVTGLFRDRQSAERAYERATSRGYGQNEVSVLLSEEARDRHFPRTETTQTELGSKVAAGAAAGAVGGGGLGAVLAGLAASGIAVPGLPIIAMGTLAAALTGAGVGGVLGALVGGLIGYGIPEERARMYERGIRDGGIVMGVTPRSSDDVDYFEREWATCGGTEICCAGTRRHAA